MNPAWVIVQFLVGIVVVSFLLLILFALAAHWGNR
jgi:hypothetical protein